MRKSVGVVIVLLVAVGIIGVVYANSHSSAKDANSSVATPANTQQSQTSESLAIQASMEPCLMVLIGVGGLIYIVGKKRRNRRRSA